MSDEFLPDAAAYALGALDEPERRRFEAHLATCAACQAEVLAQARLVAAIGLATDPLDPTGSLKAQTIARVTADMRAGTALEPARRARSLYPWALAAALALAVGASYYAWTLRQQVESLRQIVAQTSEESRRLRAELTVLRGDSQRLVRTVEIALSIDVQSVNLAGQASAASATGRAYVSPSHGLVVHAQHLPALTPGRVYQLWVLAPTPISAGLLTVAPDGTGSAVTTLPASLPRIVAVAVTNEPGPAGSVGPTLPILLVGKM